MCGRPWFASSEIAEYEIKCLVLQVCETDGDRTESHRQKNKKKQKNVLVEIMGSASATSRGFGIQRHK